MKHFYILFFFIAGCYCDTHYYPTRRTYNGCDRFVDYINYKGGPIFLLLLIVILLVLLRILGWRGIKGGKDK